MCFLYIIGKTQSYKDSFDSNKSADQLVAGNGKICCAVKTSLEITVTGREQLETEKEKNQH